MIIRNANKAAHGFIGFVREMWYNYRQEFVFGLVLSALTFLSFWLGQYIPEHIFELYINPIEYIATVTVCLIGGIVMLRHHKGNRLRKSWGVILLVWGCMSGLFLYLRYFEGIKAMGGTPDDPFYNGTVTAGNILAWLLFIYPSQVLRPGWLTWKRGLLQITPVILLGVIDYYAQANLLYIITLFPLLIFLILCSHISKYRRWCEDNFSSMDEIDTQWIVRYLTMLALCGISFYFICFTYLPNRMFTQQWLLLFVITYSTEQILFRKDPRADQLAATEPEQPEAIEVHTESNKYRATLESWMENEKPYLNPNFRLIDLRDVLPTNRTYLSQFLNNEYGCSFYQFVTNYRIEEAKRLMSAHPDMKFADVALQSGFSSQAVFSRTFTREVGKTPSEWLSESAEI